MDPKLIENSDPDTDPKLIEKLDPDPDMDPKLIEKSDPDPDPKLIEKLDCKKTVSGVDGRILSPRHKKLNKNSQSNSTFWILASRMSVCWGNPDLYSVVYLNIQYKEMSLSYFLGLKTKFGIMDFPCDTD
jgi:hypothetical protein